MNEQIDEKYRRDLDTLACICRDESVVPRDLWPTRSLHLASVIGMAFMTVLPIEESVAI